jgi:hypothetical protein
MDYKDKIARTMLKESLLKLNKQQLKLFYGMLVHAWASQRAFISKRNFFNLWCELNYLCAEVDESFPNPYDDYDLLRSFCHTHPYYFIDILSSELVITLFCRYVDNKIDVLATIADKLGTEGLKAAYEYSKDALVLPETIDELVAQAEEHLKAYS